MPTSKKKSESNRQNAQQSTGPRNTTRSRSNALSHGILSNQVLINAGEGREDAELFAQLADALREDWAPVGATEELLVDQIIMLTWRRRRLVNYETGSIREVADTAIEDWEREEASYVLGSFSTGGKLWRSTEDLFQSVEQLEADLKVLANPDPISADADI